MPPLPIRGPVAQTLTPPIPKAQAWMSSYRSTASRPLLNLSQGVPGEAPERILTDLMSELVKGRDPANYGGIRGDEALRKAVEVEMRDIYRWGSIDPQEAVSDDAGQGVDMERISISAGCNQAFYLVMSALCKEGDEIIVPCPWVRMGLASSFRATHNISALYSTSTSS
jgi:aspartate/methionine/tyrosine aminotransferase